MQVIFRFLAMLLIFSLVASSAPANSCQIASGSCAPASSQGMDCCRTTKCHCDLSAPVKPTTVPTPLRAVDITGHEIAKTGPGHASIVPLDPKGQLGLASSNDAGAHQFATVGLYTFTHAFLI
jgi:hypothetical protein